MLLGARVVFLVLTVRTPSLFKTSPHSSWALENSAFLPASCSFGQFTFSPPSCMTLSTYCLQFEQSIEMNIFEYQPQIIRKEDLIMMPWILCSPWNSCYSQGRDDRAIEQKLQTVSFPQSSQSRQDLTPRDACYKMKSR